MLPKIAASISKTTGSGGGWLTGLLNELLHCNDIELSIVFPITFQNDLLIGQVENLRYYGVPNSSSNPTIYDPKLETQFKKIVDMVSPDVVHIFGTEYPHTLAMVRACTTLGIADRVVINIQGLVSVCARHYYCALPEKTIHSYTLRDVLRHENIAIACKHFTQRGVYECEALQRVQHIIGRTDWDRACTEQINPKATYHFCNETLRDEFYMKQWNIKTCQRHSIFLSQCGYPIKGFHLMLEAMPEILRQYPDAHIYTTGTNPLLVKGIAKLKQTYYAKYLGILIHRYGLEKHVTFLGDLQEQQMCERFLQSHVFVSASSIENSPNSVGEAMLLGVPTVSSDVGGVKNMLTHDEEGFIYPYDEPYMLAYYVCKLFSDDNLALQFSNSSKQHALVTHCKQINIKNMISIYNEIYLTCSNSDL